MLPKHNIFFSYALHVCFLKDIILFQNLFNHHDTRIHLITCFFQFLDTFSKEMVASNPSDASVIEVSDCTRWWPPILVMLVLLKCQTARDGMFGPQRLMCSCTGLLPGLTSHSDCITARG